MNKIKSQQGLNAVVQKKVDRMIQNHTPLVNATIQRLMTESAISNDYIIPIGAQLKKNKTRAEVIFLEDGNKLTMNVSNNSYKMHSNAVSQLAEKMAIPAKYLRELAEGSPWQRKLAAQILNEHSLWTPRSRVLIRAVGSQVRGVLSDNYRRLNSMQIMNSFLKSAMEQGGVPCDALMTDTKIYLETILPTPLSIPTKMNGNVMIYMGARFSTSDYGDGAMDLKAFLLNGVCLNGMVRESVRKQIHLGAKLPENMQLSERTYQLDTQTTMSAIQDITMNLYSTDNIRQKALEIQAASEVEVDFAKELNNLFKGDKILRTENEGIQKLMMDNNPDDGLDGGPSLWKLAQGITAYARNAAPQRARELQELSGGLLERIK